MKTFCLATLAVGAAADCTSYSSQSKCDGDTGCSWCLSAAVPASCHSMADAKALPASIFKCDGVKETLASMATAVNAANDATWTAAPSSTRFGSLEEVKVLLGAYLPGDKAYVQLPEKNVTAFEVEAIPSDFSSATNWPKCGGMADVRDQSACGSCWAFGSTDSFQDRACVATGKDIRYSAEDTAFCSSAGNGCDGGNSAWNWFRSVGVVTGGDYTDKGSGKSCLPYSLAPCAHHVPATSKYPKCPAGEYPSPRCTNKCSDSAYPTSKSADKMKAAQAYSVRGVSKIQTEIMTHGPLYVAFTVYADFPTYKSGVYKHKSGSALGGHAVEVMGWGVEGGEKYWLVKNSWNEQWGDNGFFKIAQGTNECGIEDSVSGGTF